jgi:hypothetical protein
MSFRRLNLCPLLVSLALLIFTANVRAQTPGAAGAGPSVQEKAAALKQSLAQNQAALKQYSWTETTQISLKGEVKKQEQKECHYGPDGKVQKTPSGNSAPAQQPAAEGGRGGRVKKHVVEKKVGEMKDYMEQVAALVHEYVPPNPEKLQAVIAAKNVTAQPGSAEGIAIITFKNYLKQGDSLALGFNSGTKKLSSYNVQSYLDDPQKDPVTLAVTFDTLADGTNFPKQTVLNATGKQITVQVTNSNYKKLGT